MTRGGEGLEPSALKALREPVVEAEGGGFRHWVDALADWLEERLRLRGKEEYVFNGGLSVSGLQHIGRLRGEVILPETLRRILESRGLRVRQYLTLYTQDAWKGKREQVAQFGGGGEKYKGWPLARVPDPRGCHDSWVTHYWLDFGPYIACFTDGRVEVVTTTYMYRGRLMEFTRMVYERRGEVRETINKYRGRRPYPEGWIPWEPRCQRCGRIDSTETIAIDFSRGVARYRCRACGHEGEAPLWDGKLNWRIEWVGVWWSLGVDFEPYGKDHAVPGGSRDSACDLAVNVLGVRPPEGVPYEWVALRDGGQADMTSSGFRGVTPREWLSVAGPEVLRFLYLKTPPMRKVVVSMRQIPLYYQQYYRAERIYYGVEEARDEKERVLLSRSYELSYTRAGPPERMPAQPPYTHVAILVQILPRSLWVSEGLRRLARSGHLPENPTPFDLCRVESMMPRAYNWVRRYAPPSMRVEVKRELPRRELEAVPEELRRLLGLLAERLEGVEWREEEIKRVLVEFTEGWSQERRRAFYRAFYVAFTGRPSGPRAAPLLALLDKGMVVERLRQASSI